MPFCCYGSCSRKLPYGTFHYNQSTIDSHRLIQEFKSKLYKSITHRPIETNICTTTHSTDNTNFVSIPTIQNSHPHVDEQIQDQFMVKSTYFIDDLHINASTNALPQISPIIEHLLQIKHRHKLEIAAMDSICSLLQNTNLNCPPNWKQVEQQIENMKPYHALVTITYIQ
jgi:hypothetical protein